MDVKEHHNLYNDLYSGQVDQKMLQRNSMFENSSITLHLWKYISIQVLI